jgi:hypothetical protein
LIKATAASHPDSGNLTVALKKIETVVTIINEGARQAKNVHKMIEIQSKLIQRIVAPSRTLIKYGAIEAIVSSGDKKSRQLYLFNDMLIVTKEESDKCKLINMCAFENFVTPYMHANDACGFRIALFVSPHLTIFTFFDTEKIKESWNIAIRQAITEWNSNKNRIVLAKKTQVKHLSRLAILIKKEKDVPLRSSIISPKSPKSPKQLVLSFKNEDTVGSVDNSYKKRTRKRTHLNNQVSETSAGTDNEKINDIITPIEINETNNLQINNSPSSPELKRNENAEELNMEST